MTYCPRCHILTESGICGQCGHAARAPEPNDDILLVTVDRLHADMLAPLLDDAGIPYIRRCDLGGAFGMPGGMLLVDTKFFVLYAAFRRARALVRDVFSDDPAVMSTLAGNEEDREC